MKKPTMDDVRKVVAESGHIHEDPSTPSTDDSPEARIEQLAALSTLQYALRRQAAAKALKVSLEFLDKAVQEARAKSGSGKSKQGQEITFPDILPADDPVDGCALLDTLLTVLKRFLVLPPGAPEAIVLWILRTFAFDLFTINPRLIISSPEKQCGKSTLMGLLIMLLPKPLPTSNITPASIFRVIDKCQPSLLIDEMDSFQHIHEELRGILNSGHMKKLAYVIRTVGDDNEPRQFSTWAPMALAAIGKFPDTLEDRSLKINLQRKKKNDPVKPLPETGPELDALEAELEPLKRQCVRWVQDHMQAIVTAKPTPIDELSSRGRNNWYSLLSLANVIGGEWPEKVRLAAVLISGEKADSQTIGVQLLADIYEVFETKKKEKIPSKDLCEYLKDLEERPWATWSKGFPISQNQLARKLKGFGISSKGLRQPDDKVVRGYDKDNFLEVWERYCVSPSGNPVSKCDSATTPMNTGQTPVFQGATEASCSTLDNGTFANTGAVCSTVAVQNQGYGAEHTQPFLLDSTKETFNLDD